MHRLLALVLLATTVACSAAVGNGAATSPRDSGRSKTIEPVAPVRDSVGAAPARFAWTAVEGADTYAIGIWNEVDVLVWRDDHVTGTSVTRPDTLQLEPGTYFWSVSALRQGQEISDSGLSAFVVRTTP